MNSDSETEGTPRVDQRLAPWEVLERQELLARPPWLAVLQERVRLPSGRVVDDFYRIVLPEFALVVPQTPDGRYVMVRGYKHGAGQVALSPPAGLIQAGESPQAAAARELREETGYRALGWRFIARLAADGNRQCGLMHLFLAENAQLVAAPQDDDTEVLDVELLSRGELLAAIDRGEVATMAAAAGIGLALALRAQGD
jgi:8-oxo-dGTP pyrophosphatase MutT (NUDIX family)